MEFVEEFENKIAEFYGAKYAVATDCCTHAIELCLRYSSANNISVPNRTYLSVPMTLEKLNLEWSFNQLEWVEYYCLNNTNIIDAAVYWRQNGFKKGYFNCLSFQFKKHLSLGRGGMILTDDAEAAKDLKKMSYDGRLPNIPWAEQNVSTMGYHYYMTPETAKLGLDKLNEAIITPAKEWSYKNYPCLNNMDFFKNKV
jgi:dTDP-4-amino-4,6-dideoxygalactose transaminase